MGLIAKRTPYMKRTQILLRTGHKKCSYSPGIDDQNFKWDWRIITNTVQKEPISWETIQRPKWSLLFKKNWLYCLRMSGSLTTEFWGPSRFRLWWFRQKMRETGEKVTRQNLNLLFTEHFLLSCGILVHYCLLSWGEPKRKYITIIFSKNFLKHDSVRWQPVLHFYFRAKEIIWMRMTSAELYDQNSLYIFFYIKHRLLIHFLVSDWHKNLIKG